MRTCAVPGCKGRFSFNGSKVHKLPETEPMKSAWIEAVPALGESSVKCPAVCCLHFSSSDYGRNRKYLKPTAIPSRHLSMFEGSLEDPVQVKNKHDSQDESHQCPDVMNCEKVTCQELFLAARNLQTHNQRLISHIKTLEKKICNLEDQVKKPSLTEGVKSMFSDIDFMLGPTQMRCILNKVSFPIFKPDLFFH